jgi:hypothetical protein
VNQARVNQIVKAKRVELRAQVAAYQQQQQQQQQQQEQEQEQQQPADREQEEWGGEGEGNALRMRHPLLGGDGGDDGSITRRRFRRASSVCANQLGLAREADGLSGLDGGAGEAAAVRKLPPVPPTPGRKPSRCNANAVRSALAGGGGGGGGGAGSSAAGTAATAAVHFPGSLSIFDFGADFSQSAVEVPQRRAIFDGQHRAMAMCALLKGDAPADSSVVAQPALGAMDGSNSSSSSSSSSSSNTATGSNGGGGGDNDVAAAAAALCPLDFDISLEVFPVTKPSDVVRLFLEVNKVRVVLRSAPRPSRAAPALHPLRNDGRHLPPHAPRATPPAPRSRLTPPPTLHTRSQGENVQEIDLPNALAPVRRRVIDGAVAMLMDKYPAAMFSASLKCRAPHLNRDALRNDLFVSSVGASADTAQGLFALLERHNKALAAKPTQSWPAKLRGKKLEKAARCGLFLGLTKVWLEGSVRS